MAKIKNLATGPRGFHSLAGEVTLDPGRSWEGEISDGELASAKSTGNFEIDGTAPASSHPAHAANAELSDQVAALVAENSDLSAKLDAANAELKPHRIRAAVAGLDHANDAHWTQGGEPKVDVVAETVGSPLTRADITDAAPDAKRAA
jgi:hypothetical protein